MSDLAKNIERARATMNGAINLTFHHFAPSVPSLSNISRLHTPSGKRNKNGHKLYDLLTSLPESVLANRRHGSHPNSIYYSEVVDEPALIAVIHAAGFRVFRNWELVEKP